MLPPDRDKLLRLSSDVGVLLERTSMKVATAESCTGGGIAYYLTAIAGSSNWFETGFVTYSNDAKADRLAVPVALLEMYGAVSEPVAAAMADGALTCSGADYAISVTGVAGPGGGSSEKPVGMVCFGWARRNGGTVTDTQYFKGNRDDVRTLSIYHSLVKLKSQLEM